MNRNISPSARAALLSGLANLAAPVSTLLTGPLLARALGPEGRGHVAALIAPLALATLIFPFGLPDSLTYFCAGQKLSKDRAIGVAVCGSAFSSVAAVSISALSAHFLFRHQQRYIAEFYLLLLTLPPILLFAALRGIVQSSTEGFAFVNTEKALAAAGRLLVLLGLFAFGRLTPLSTVWVSMLMQVGASLVLLAGFRGSLRPSFSKLPLRMVLEYATVVGVGTLAAIAVIRLDQSLMVSLTTPAELAYYVVAVSMAELPLSAVGALRDVAFTEATLRNDPAVTARFSRMTIAAVGLLCSAEALLAPLALPLLFGEAFRPAILMAEILLLATLGRAVTTILGAGLLTTGKTWSRSLIQLTGAGLTTILLFAFVPAWGGLGAAWVTTLTYLLLGLLTAFSFTKSAGVSLADSLLPTAEEFRKLTQIARTVWRRR